VYAVPVYPAAQLATHWLPLNAFAHAAGHVPWAIVAAGMPVQAAAAAVMGSSEARGLTVTVRQSATIELSYVLLINSEKQLMSSTSNS
jgi:hypothetical protein